MQRMQLVVLFLALSACAFSLCGCGHPKFDRGRELVNAAGLSKDELLRVLSKGCDVNERSSSTFGWTPLISAIYHRKEEAVDILLAHGADVNGCDAVEHQTPLIWAIKTWSDNTNVIRTLLRHGADPRIRNRFGSNASDAAKVQTNAAEVLEILSSAELGQGNERTLKK